LVNGTIAVRWEEALAELPRQLIEHIASLIKSQIGKHHSSSERAGRSVLIVIHFDLLIVFCHLAYSPFV
jgi:hypothetical protein